MKTRVVDWLKNRFLSFLGFFLLVKSLDVSTPHIAEDRESVGCIRRIRGSLISRYRFLISPFKNV